MATCLFSFPETCAACGKESTPDAKLMKCKSCECARYCNRECQRADWSQHKKYCKHILYVRKKHLSAFVESRNKADPSVSEVYTAALASARAAGNPLDVTYCQMPAKAAEKFVQYCNADILPSGPMEEQIWGLYGDPKSSGYQQLYVAYQRALKYGDLSAHKLMDCLLARPHASQALTKALQDVKIVQTEGDCYEQTVHVLRMYRSVADGLEVVSTFDRWPIKD